MKSKSSSRRKTVEKLKKTISGRALNRRRFMTALGVTGAASGAALMSRRGTGSKFAALRPSVIQAAGPAQTDYLNYLLNIAYLQATYYAFITTGADIPVTSGVLQGSGVIYSPPNKITFPNQQITDLVNELYYDEISKVIGLRNLLGTAAINRPAMNMQGNGGTTSPVVAVTQTNPLGIARVFEDVSATAYAGIVPLLTGANLTYASQLLAVEAIHAGSVRLLCLQNPTTAPYVPTTAVPIIGITTSGSNQVTNVNFNAITPVVGQVVTGAGIPAGTTITAITGSATISNISFTGTWLTTAKTVTAVSSVNGLAVGQPVTGTGIAAGTTITAIVSVAPLSITLSATPTAAGTAAALVAGSGTITLSANATASAPAQTSVTLSALDTMDVPPADLGSAASSGPTTVGGFFATAGASNSTPLTPQGLAFARTSSQVLAVLYGLSTLPAVAGIAKGGYFPSGFSGAINTI